MQAAAKHYFSKDAKDLNLPQAALLAGLAQNPGTTDPVNNPERAIARRNVVLDRMHELGLITDKEVTDAKAVTLADMLKVTSAPTACQASGDVYATSATTSSSGSSSTRRWSRRSARRSTSARPRSSAAA